MTVCTENYIRATADEGRLESDVTGGCLCAELGDAPARLCPAGDRFGSHCSNERRSAGRGADAPHHDNDVVGISRRIDPISRSESCSARVAEEQGGFFIG
jgi:hypothetical protein